MSLDPELMLDLEKTLPEAEAQAVFIKAYEKAFDGGKSHDVSLALAWGEVFEFGCISADDAYVTKAYGAKPLYMSRPVINAEDICQWAAEQGFSQCLVPDDMHVTVVFSRTPFSRRFTDIAEGKNGSYYDEPYEYEDEYNRIVVKGGKRSVVPLGDKGAIVLKFEDPGLSMDHQQFREMGASWDHDVFQPHLSITYQGEGMDLSSVQPYTGEIILGAPVWRLLSDDWRAIETPLAKAMMQVEILKMDEEQRIVWGWAYVSTIDGELQVDSHSDSIETVEMVKMANEYMKGVRAVKVMHEGENRGGIVHSLPLTAELAKFLGIETNKEGWIVGMYVSDDEAWEATKSSSFTGFSIGGRAKAREKY